MRDPKTWLDCAVTSRPDFPSASGLVVWDEQKMSVSGLKAELKFLESIFDPNHERFRIIDWKPDELSCQFNVTGEKLLIIHCNITVSPRPALRTKLAPAADYRLKALGGRFRVYNMNANFVFGFFFCARPASKRRSPPSDPANSRK